MTLSPGKILLRDVLEPLNIRPEELASAAWMSTGSVNRILSGESPISPEAAIRFEAALGEKAETFLAQQASYDLELARKSVDISQLTLLNANLSKDLLKIKLKSLFDFHVAQKTEVDMVELNKICAACDIDTFFEMVLEVDPNRTLFDAPIGKLERGLHGLPLLESRFHFVTNEDGISIDSECADLPNDFATAAQLGKPDSPLSSCLRIAWDKEAHLYCFIQLTLIDVDSAPDQESMIALSKQFGVCLHVFSTLVRSDEPAKMYLVACTYEPSFRALDAISLEQIGLAGNWKRKALR